MARRNVVHQIRRATQKRYSAEEKIRIVLEGLRGGALPALILQAVAWSGFRRSLSTRGPSSRTAPNRTS
jgi:transposase-like protein